MTTSASPTPAQEPPQLLRNRPFDELAVGDSARIERTLTQQVCRTWTVERESLMALACRMGTQETKKGNVASTLPF